MSFSCKAVQLLPLNNIFTIEQINVAMTTFTTNIITPVTMTVLLPSYGEG
jgi:hypothetical protein